MLSKFFPSVFSLLMIDKRCRSCSWMIGFYARSTRKLRGSRKKADKKKKKNQTSKLNILSHPQRTSLINVPNMILTMWKRITIIIPCAIATSHRLGFLRCPLFRILVFRITATSAQLIIRSNSSSRLSIIGFNRSALHLLMFIPRRASSCPSTTFKKSLGAFQPWTIF